MADTSIYQQLQPQPFNNPFKQLAEIRAQQQQRQSARQQQQLVSQQIASNQALEEERRQKIKKEEAERAQDEALRVLFSGAEQPKPSAIVGLVGPERGAKIIDGLTALKKSAQGDFTQTQETVRKVLLGMNALPEAVRAEQYPKVRGALVQRGVITESDAPEAYDPAWFTQAVNFGKEPKEAPAPTPFTLSPGQQRFDPSGKLLATAAEKPPEHSPQYKEWQDYQKEGGKLGFNDYSTMDANRHRPVSITNAATDDKMIDEAARNILANPRDITSLKTITSLRGDQRLKLFNKLKEKDSSFNVGNIDRQIKFLDSYEDPKGRAATNRGSMNNILQHAADLSSVNEQYRRTDLRIANTPVAVLQRQMGTEWGKFQVPLSVLKDEIGLYFAGGYAPTSDQQKTWNSIANDTATPAQIEQFAKDIIHVGLRRADTHNEQFKTVMGYDDPNLITPQAVQAGEKLGLGAEMKKYGSGGTIGGKPAAATGQAGMKRARDPQGRLHEAPAGTALPPGWTAEP